MAFHLIQSSTKLTLEYLEEKAHILTGTIFAEDCKDLSLEETLNLHRCRKQELVRNSLRS